MGFARNFIAVKKVGHILTRWCRIAMLSIVIAGFPALPLTKAQLSEKDFTRYSVKEGLSDNGITSLLQDRKGYLWIGTDAGLNRFDGHRFKKYYQGTEPLRLPSGSISRMMRFGRDSLGIVCKAGFALLNTDDYSLRHFAVPDSSAFSAYINSAWDVVQFSDGSFAVTTAAGFYVFDETGRIILRYDAYRMNDIGQKRILYGRDIFQIDEHLALIYTEQLKLALYDHKNKSYSELSDADSIWSAFIHPHARENDAWVVKRQLSRHEFLFIPTYEDVIIYYDHLSNRSVVSPLPFRIIGTLNWESQITAINDSVLALNHETRGFYFLQLDRKTGRITCDGRLHLPEYQVICMLTDKDNRLWVGTTEGLLKQELQPSVISPYRFRPPEGEQFAGGFMCTFLHQGLLYAGRHAHRQGLAVIRAGNMQLLREISLFGENSVWNEIRSIQMYHPDTLWIGTSMGLVWYDTRSGMYGKVLDEQVYPWAANFSPILAPPREDGYAWMCSHLGGMVVRYHIPSRRFTVFTSETTPALPFDRVKSIAYDSYGDVWIGGHSLARWNNKKQEFDTLITVYGGPNKFGDNIIVLTADTDGSLWFHNAYNGLLEYRIKDSKFVHYSVNDGLPSDVLQSLSPVIDQTMWIAANNQLAMFNIRNKLFTIYDVDDGLPEQKPTGRQIHFDPATGSLYLCSNEYLVRFPFEPKESADLSSDLLLEEVIIDNQRTYYEPEEPLRINYKDNTISLAYTIIDFEKSNYQFSYRLSPEANWTSVGDQRTITLSHLPAGPYTIEMRASGKPGVEKVHAFSFLIRTPIWRSPLFITMVCVLAGGGLYLLYWNRIQSIRQKAQIDRLLSQTEMKALQAQMNPHFVFNSLNSIGEMILNNENKDASHYLSKFARLIRITLDQSTESMVSLRNTIDYLERYMEMENIRNSHFSHQITVDPVLDIDDTLVPPMLLQPFIENAIWHGVTAAQKRIHVHIDFMKRKDHLVCRIDDNGVGIHHTRGQRYENGGHQPIGIQNIQNRITLLNKKYNLHCEMSIMDKGNMPGSLETGTLVTLQLPLEIDES